MKSKKFKNIFFTIIVLLFLSLVLSGSYAWWNTAAPDKTCLNCHEIGPSHSTWTTSAHREISCFKCHGTALESGLHSLTEKARMVVRHVTSKPRSEDVRLSEAQVLEVMDRCIVCHQSEYANWISGGHSANYSDIFLNETQNSTEQLNFDCLRCHGMFYPGTILDLVEPISKEGPWHLVDKKMMDKPTIPCMACHQIHTHGEIAKRPDYVHPGNIFFGKRIGYKSNALYIRNEKMYLELTDLPTPVILSGSDTILAPADPTYRLCIQCHAPTVYHQTASSDDRTPTGVHEGLSCSACHEPHSNNQRNSCDRCHPAISNCKLDVKTMNTSYLLSTSKHNIHFVACGDCHDSLKNETL